jgi:flavin-dependent dehydrogenase
MHYDVIIIGASFSGLALAHYLPKSLRVLVLDRKPKLDATIESTGLVTQVTHDMLAELVDVDRFIPNKVTTIGVVSPDYDKYFFSHTKKPWIYTTDTPNLVKNMAETVPQNVTIEINSNFRKYGVNPKDDYPVQVMYSRSGKEFNVQAKFIVGADGSHSQVAKSNPNLSRNKRFLAGLEKVFYGDIHLGDHPKNTVYHFWFGEFSIGYGGWLSPTIINGKHAFRVGLAKLEKDIVHLKLLDKFIQILKDRRIISLADEKCQDAFGSLIPINGVLKNLYDDHSALIGDAAGFCGAFAADGIKGSLISAKVVAKLLPQRLRGDLKAFRAYKKEVNKHGKLMKYYFKQRLYRFIWDRMKRNRSFHAMFDIIQREKEGFLNQFCDNMKKATSLTRTVLKLHNFHRLVKYSIYIAIDIVFPKKR